MKVVSDGEESGHDDRGAHGGRRGGEGDAGGDGPFRAARVGIRVSDLRNDGEVGEEAATLPARDVDWGWEDGAGTGRLHPEVSSAGCIVLRGVRGRFEGMDRGRGAWTGYPICFFNGGFRAR